MNYWGLVARILAPVDRLYWHARNEAMEWDMRHGRIDFVEIVIDEGASLATCYDCGEELELVRPGKWQCNHCE